MKFCIFFLASSLMAQNTPPPGTPAGGYTPTIYNKEYGKGYLGNDVDPMKDLETMYPESSPSVGKDDRTTGATFGPAKAQAVYWLSLIDQKAYGASWSQAGALLQAIVSQNIWSAGLKAVTQNLGNVQSRKVGDHQLVSNLKGIKGKFMVITFDSTFSSKSVKEMVTLQDQGGQWKVVSYSISS